MQGSVRYLNFTFGTTVGAHCRPALPIIVFAAPNLGTGGFVVTMTLAARLTIRIAVPSARGAHAGETERLGFK